MINLPKLERELKTAGAAEWPFSWKDDGTVYLDDSLTDKQREKILRVFELHDPTPAPEYERRLERRAALLALVGAEEAEDALDQFLTAIKARPDLPFAVRQYVSKYGL